MTLLLYIIYSHEGDDVKGVQLMVDEKGGKSRDEVAFEQIARDLKIPYPCRPA